VRSLVVVDAPPVVEGELLGAEVGARRPSRFALEVAVHALVARVLLRFAGLDEFGCNAEGDPPDGELGEAAPRSGSEGNAIVGADALRQTELTEEMPETAQGYLKIKAQHAAAFEQEARVAVLHGEGKAELSVASPEFAFEVSGPGAVRPVWERERRTRMGLSPSGLPVLNVAIPIEDPLDGVDAGKAPEAGILLEHAADLSSSPTEAFPDIEDSLDEIWACGVGTRQRPARAVLQGVQGNVTK
jgi:hypothetical protein